jgi:membrane-bound lytic murein transglycosylase B
VQRHLWRWVRPTLPVLWPLPAKAVLGVLSVLIACLLPTAAAAHHGAKRAATWDHLTTQLVADGIPAETVRRAYRDHRVGNFDGVEYALVVKESKRSYRDFLGPKSLAAARRCRRRYARHFETFGKEHGVDPDIVAAILYIETRCGAYTGNRVALRQLSRLAIANEPENVARNIRRLQRKEAADYTPAEIARIARERAAYLHQTFYPEVLAIFRLGAQVGINPAGIRGSSAGAFGLPQFLPSNYLRFAQDGNENGRVSLYEAPDAIHSTMHFLRHHGWKPGLSQAQKRSILWRYNRSDPYIDTILLVADKLSAN